MSKKNKKTSNIKKILVGILAFILFSVFIAMPVASAIVYESIFSQRFEPAPELAFEPEDFPGLIQETCTFESAVGEKLAGFMYERDDIEQKALAVIVHGMGGGGQSLYMDVADFLTKNGYAVFAYDATGNGKSEGEDVRGLPQGVMDLDKALDYVKTLPEYKDMPIVLFGHSWGAYSTGCVLKYHPDVKAVVMVAGFNESKNLLEQESVNTVGPVAKLTLPYVCLYERIKFGEFSQASAVEGFESSDAGVMILHSTDDKDVLPENGYEIFFEKFSDSPRFEFLLFEDRGHSFLYYTNGDNKQGLDNEVMTQILTFFAAYI